MQEPVGEEVAAFRIGAKLDLIDGEKFDLAVERHRLDRADEVARPGGNDLFFAGDQRDLSRAPRLDHPIVNFARQQPQRQADHAGGMSQHPLHRQMRLARVRRAKNCNEPRGVAPRWRAIHERQCGTCRRAPQASALVLVCGSSDPERHFSLTRGRAAPLLPLRAEGANLSRTVATSNGGKDHVPRPSRRHGPCRAGQPLRASFSLAICG